MKNCFELEVHWQKQEKKIFFNKIHSNDLNFEFNLEGFLLEELLNEVEKVQQLVNTLGNQEKETSLEDPMLCF